MNLMQSWTTFFILCLTIPLVAAAQEEPEPAQPETEELETVAISPEIRQEVQLAIQKSLLAFKHNFKARVESRQLNAMFAKEIETASPIPISVESLELIHNKQTSMFRASFGGLPPAFKEEVEKQANEVLKKSGINTMWNKMTRTYMEEAEKALLKETNVFIKKETDKVLLVLADNLDSEFHGNIRLNAILISIDRENKWVNGAKLTLSEGKGLLVRMIYAPHDIPGETEPVPVWTAIQVQQNSWLGRLMGMVGWPNKMVAKFEDYTFL